MSKETVDRAFHVMKKGLLGRHRLLAPVAGFALFLASCSAPDVPIDRSFAAISREPSSIGFPAPSLPNIVPDPMAKNICAPIAEVTDPVIKIIRGESEPMEQVIRVAPSIEASPDSDDDLNVKPSDINNGGRPVNLSKYQVILIPVDYEPEEIEKEMPRLLDVYQKAFRNVNVEFSYLKFSVPVNTKDKNRLIQLMNSSRMDRIVQKIRKGSWVDGASVIVKSDIEKGSCCPPIASLRNKLVYGIHEEAHRFDLYDGASVVGQYTEEQVRNEQVFTDYETLRPRAKKALEKKPLTIYYTGDVCNGRAVLTVGNPAENPMMNYVPDNEKFLRDLDIDDPFNSVQEEIMNDKIDESILQRQF